MPTPPTAHRRWLAFSLRSLFVLTVLVALPLAKLTQVRDQRRAVELLRDAGCSVQYDYLTFGYQGTLGQPSGPAWLRRLVGDDIFANVAYVNFECTTPYVDDLLPAISRFPAVKYLIVRGVSDAGLEHTAGASDLIHVVAIGDFTDSGVARLTMLPKLESLGLFSRNMTDVSLGHLQRCTSLKELRVDGDGFSEAAERQLREALPNCEIIIETWPNEWPTYLHIPWIK